MSLAAVMTAACHIVPSRSPPCSPNRAWVALMLISLLDAWAVSWQQCWARGGLGHGGAPAALQPCGFCLGQQGGALAVSPSHFGGKTLLHCCVAVGSALVLLTSGKIKPNQVKKELDSRWQYVPAFLLCWSCHLEQHLPLSPCLLPDLSWKHSCSSLPAPLNFFLLLLLCMTELCSCHNSGMPRCPVSPEAMAKMKPS